MVKEINVGLIGYQFMGKAHSNAYRQVTKFFKPEVVPIMKAICGRDEEKVKEAAKVLGWESYETSWEKLIKRKDIDLIDISTPNYNHCQIACAAAEEKKIVFCEKPLAMNVEEAKRMVDAVTKNKIIHMICFNYRRVPAVVLAKKLISEGKIGKIYHIRATYLQEWAINPNLPLLWRFRKDLAGSGAHGDLNAHIIDMARYLVGEFEEVCGYSITFIKERPLPEGKGKGEVTVDDATLFLAKFVNGAVGTFEATRFAPGRKNYHRWEINGSNGSIVFNLERMNELDVYFNDDPEDSRGFRNIIVTEKIHPYYSAWWPHGHIIGYEHTFIHTVADLLDAVAKNKLPEPNFIDGLRAQEVLEAVEISVKERRWVKISELQNNPLKN